MEVDGEIPPVRSYGNSGYLAVGVMSAAVISYQRHSSRPTAYLDADVRGLQQAHRADHRELADRCYVWRLILAARLIVVCGLVLLRLLML